MIQQEFVDRAHFVTHIKSTRVPLDEKNIKTLTNTLRWLRNNAPQLNESTKQELLKSGIVESCGWYFDNYFMDEPLNCSILLQFLANLSIDHKMTQQHVFQCFHSKLKKCILSTKNSKLLNYLLMLLYNLCLHNFNFRMDILKDFDIIQSIITNLAQHEIEYSKIFLDLIFSNKEDFYIVYTHLPDDNKGQLIDLLSIWLDYYIDNVSLDVVNTIKNELFINCTIKHITGSIVNVLAKASNINRFRSDVQNCTLLLKKALGILIVIHESGKRSSKNEFSRINDLSALFESSEVQSHKRFDFKSDLIRLITNMCYNHSKHQDLICTNGIIPILLECCSFDAKNPLMREWCLFALQNIMAKNPGRFEENLDLIDIVETVIT